MSRNQPRSGQAHGRDDHLLSSISQNGYGENLDVSRTGTAGGVTLTREVSDATHSKGLDLPSGERPFKSQRGNVQGNPSLPANNVARANLSEREEFQQDISIAVPRTEQFRLANALAVFDQVALSGKFNFQQARIPLSHNLNMASWREELQGFSDIMLCEFLEFGWPANYEPTAPLYSVDRNHSSALSFLDQLRGFVGHSWGNFRSV